jgi:hypothetical protein
METKQILLGGLLAGLAINVCDVTITVMTVAKKWQGIRPSALTPPYYVTASFLAGIVLAWTFSSLAVPYGFSRSTALMASLLLWGISRLYGAGHVVMGQMPLAIFTVMSLGLCLGFVAAGQVLFWYFRKYPA